MAKRKAENSSFRDRWEADYVYHFKRQTRANVYLPTLNSRNADSNYSAIR